jgi:hypothetical protein
MIKTPFTGTVGPGMVPTKGSNGVFDSEPGLPAGMPGRTGGLLPEKHRDTAVPGVTPKPLPDASGSFVWR